MHLAFLLLFLTIFPLAHAADSVLEPITPHLSQANLNQGKQLFLQCRGCHVAAADAQYTIGPNLWGVIDRKVASMPNYPYSTDLKAIGGSWDYEKLNRYLWNPKNMAPNGNMFFPGLKRGVDRLNLIAYLRTLSDNPPPLPTPPTVEEDTPTYGSLPAGNGQAAVYFTCRACHALEQFTDKKLSREDWDETLNNMVKKNGMAVPENWVRKQLLDYLSEHYGVQAAQDWQGLPAGAGREEVFYTCNVCHSLKLVMQQNLSRDSWAETLEWMVEEQGMSEIEDEEVKARLLDYLATHYGVGH